MKIPNNLLKQFQILKEMNIDISENFIIPEQPLKYKLLRKLASPIVRHLPLKCRYFLTDIVKKYRNPEKKLKLNYPLDFPEIEGAANKICKLGEKPWWGKKAVICISHDVDNIQGYNFIEEMAALELNCGIKTTYNFLTDADYIIKGELIEYLSQNGFEIGIHGDYHDQGLAFRSPEMINRRLKTCLDYFNVSSRYGFRSPALSLSKNLLFQLGQNKFLFDSTFQIGAPFYHSVKIPYPYYFEEFNLWELPLMVQDDTYFRDSASSYDTVLESINRYISETITLNGVMVINMHPHLMLKHQDFYRNFLKLIKSNKEILCTTTNAVIYYIDSNINN